MCCKIRYVTKVGTPLLVLDTPPGGGHVGGHAPLGAGHVVLFGFQNMVTLQVATSERAYMGARGLSHTRGIQEAAGQPSVRYALRWIPALSRGLDSMALWPPSNSTIPCFYSQAGQPSVRCALRWIPAMRRGLDSMTL